MPLVRVVGVPVDKTVDMLAGVLDKLRWPLLAPASVAANRAPPAGCRGALAPD
jgi:hypothetical protein